MTVTPTEVDPDREAAIEAAFRWLKYEESSGPVKLDRDFVAQLFDAAHQDGSLHWTGEVPAIRDCDLDADLLEAVQQLQALRDEFRQRSYAAMNRIAQIVGLAGPR